MIMFIAALGVLMVGLYAVVLKSNIIKKLMGLSILANGLHIFLISLGYRTGGVMPILQELDFQRFAATAVDPIPQALVLTSIVINFSVLAVGLSISIILYRQFGTLDTDRIRRLRG